MVGTEKKPHKSRLSPELLQKIKEAIPITEIVGEHVVLRKAGANFSGLCPFHSERSPSFSVSESKGFYHCFGCKKSGDLLSFTMEINGISFPEAVEELAERAKIPLPKDWEGEDSSDPETQKRRAAQKEKLSTAYKLNRFAAAFYHQNLAVYPDFERYFDTRGVNAELRRSFYVGVAPAAWDTLATHLVNKKAPLPLAVELGLIQPSQKNTQHSGPGYFDLFRNRAMFPIIDTRGKVVGFGGRLMPSENASASDDKTEGPKYLNSKESFIFSKGKVAFGLYQAQKHIREKNEVILVEGYFDVLALHAAGFENVVATCGTALTVDHLQLFRRFADRITLLFDGDKAGVTATARAMETGLQNGAILYGAVMPEGLDPDEILFDQTTGKPTSNGLERMKAILADAKPILDTRIEDALTYAQKGPEEKTVALKQVAQWLGSFADPVGREVRIHAFINKLGIGRNLFDQAMGGRGAPRIDTHLPQNPNPHKKLQKAKDNLFRSEEILLVALIQQSLDLPAQTRIIDNLPKERTLAELFEHPELRTLFLKIQKASPAPWSPPRPRAEIEAQVSAIEDLKLKALITEALMSESARFNSEEIKIAVDRSLKRIWAQFSQTICAALKDAESKKDADLEQKLMQDYLDVQKKLKEFSSFYDEA